MDTVNSKREIKDPKDALSSLEHGRLESDDISLEGRWGASL